MSNVWLFKVLELYLTTYHLFLCLSYFFPPTQTTGKNAPPGKLGERWFSGWEKFARISPAMAKEERLVFTDRPATIALI